MLSRRVLAQVERPPEDLIEEDRYNGLPKWLYLFGVAEKPEEGRELLLDVDPHGWCGQGACRAYMIMGISRSAFAWFG
ncbi:MAG: hypothetical protein PVF70_14140 [Anaerolineales bacterium]|jgi:hypothetical protein